MCWFTFPHLYALSVSIAHHSQILILTPTPPLFICHFFLNSIEWMFSLIVFIHKKHDDFKKKNSRNNNRNIHKKKKSWKKRKWVRDWIRRREVEDTAQKLIQDLRNEDSNTFTQFFRTSGEQFDYLLDKIRPSISKQDTRMRTSISAESRLLITLRYSSTGDSYSLFRVAHNTISSIVGSTCRAISKCMRREYLMVILAIKRMFNMILYWLLCHQLKGSRYGRKMGTNRRRILCKMEFSKLHWFTGRKTYQYALSKKQLLYEF